MTAELPPGEVYSQRRYDRLAEFRPELRFRFGGRRHAATRGMLPCLLFLRFFGAGFFC
jgi:hypothetical protein